MSLIKPKQKTEQVQIKINIESFLLEDIKMYCDYAGLSKLDDFFEGAALHILSKDSGFKSAKTNASKLLSTAEKAEAV